MKDFRKPQVWRRILGHELNNSPTPIKSIAGSLGSLWRRAPRAADWEEDMQAYARLARLAPLALAPCDIVAPIGRATGCSVALCLPT